MAYRKRVRLTKRTNLNISGKGIGLSTGIKGVRIGIGPNGIRTTTSIPGTGIYKTTTLASNKKQVPLHNTQGASNMSSKDISTRGIIIAMSLVFTGLACFVFSIIIGLIFIGLGAFFFIGSRGNGTKSITDDSSENVFTPFVLSEMELLSVENKLKIASESVQLVNSTVNPEVFFSRYALVIDMLEKLVSYEKYNIFDNSSPPSSNLQRAKEKQELAIRDFITRAYNKEMESAKTLKTVRGKINRMENFFASLEPYMDKMLANNIEYFNDLKTSYKENL